MKTSVVRSIYSVSTSEWVKTVLLVHQQVRNYAQKQVNTCTEKGNNIIIEERRGEEGGREGGREAVGKV